MSTHTKNRAKPLVCKWVYLSFARERQANSLNNLSSVHRQLIVTQDSRYFSKGRLTAADFMNSDKFHIPNSP